jgi:hypothetical protein
LLKNEKYEIIHENEEIALYIRDNNNIIVLSLNEIKPICDYNIEEIKEEFRKKISNYTVIFID